MEGEWVQDYTRRGAPRQGRYRWCSASEKRHEAIAAVLIAAAVVSAIALPALIYS